MKLSARRTVLAGIVSAGLGLSAFTSMGASAAVAPNQTIATIGGVSQTPDRTMAPSLGYGQLWVHGTTPPASRMSGGVVVIDVTDTKTGIISKLATKPYLENPGSAASGSPAFSWWRQSSVTLPTEGAISVCGHKLSVRASYFDPKTKKQVFSAPKTLTAYCGPRLEGTSSGGASAVTGRFFSKGKVQLTFRRTDTGATRTLTTAATGTDSRGVFPARAPLGQTSRFTVKQPFGTGCFNYTVVAKDLTTGRVSPTLRTAETNGCVIL